MTVPDASEQNSSQVWAKLQILELFVSQLFEMNSISWSLLKAKLTEMESLVLDAVDCSDLATYWQGRLATFWVRYGLDELDTIQFTKQWFSARMHFATSNSSGQLKNAHEVAKEAQW